jgi:inner membrane protein
MPTLLIGANLPDIDVLAMFLGGTASLYMRRGWTHGVLALVVLPFLLAGAMLAWDRYRASRRRGEPLEPASPAWLLALSTIAILSHPALDWLNSYGLRWLMPFSDRWFYGDALFIVDPWVWLALATAVVLGKRAGWRSRAPRVMLGAVAAYIAMNLGLTQLGRAEVRRAVAASGESPPERLMVGPVPANPFRREVVYLRDGVHHFGDMVFVPTPRLSWRDITVPVGDDHAAVARAAETVDGRHFLYWSRFPVFTVHDRDGHTLVRISDARYSLSSRGDWASVVVRVDHDDVP